jgi:hypothetical protein
VGFYRITVDSSADDSNSLAEESVAFRQFPTRFMFRSILEYLDNTRYRGTIDTSCTIMFGKENNRRKREFQFDNINAKHIPFS